MAFRPLGSGHLTKFNSITSCNLLNDYSSFVDSKIVEAATRPSHKTFAPSSFRCQRRQWFRIRGVYPDKMDQSDADQYLEFSAQMGTACHRIIQTNLRDMLNSSESLDDAWIDVDDYLESGSTDLVSYKLESDPDSLETKIEIEDPPVRFACDGIIKLKNKLYLLEIKTSEFASFDELTDPKSKHIAQVEMYCSLLNLRDVIFIYQDRQYGQMKCFEHNVSDARCKEIRDTMKKVMVLAENQICPDPLPKGDPWCTKAMCPYYVTCYKWGR